MDNFVVSARKYRPQTFASVVGQGSITSTLKNAIERGQLAGAYLFCGPRGVGKTTCARIFAKAINCMNPNGAEACNELLIVLLGEGLEVVANNLERKVLSTGVEHLAAHL